MAKIGFSVLFKNSTIKYMQILNVNKQKFHMTSTRRVQIGDTIPSVDLYERDPGTVFNTSKLLNKSKVVLIGVPGAFTPYCSRAHLPGYVEKYIEFKKKGVDEIVCVSVNDAFVMHAWGLAHDAIGKIRMLADPNGTFTELMGLHTNFPHLGGLRSKRYSLVLENGIITRLNIEPDGMAVTCSLASKLSI